MLSSSSLHRAGTFPIVGASEQRNDEKIDMDFRRAGRRIRLVATHEPVAHRPANPAGTRGVGHQRAAAANRRVAARGVL